MNFSGVVRQALEKKNMKVPDLARDVGLSKQYIYELLDGTKRWNEETIEKVCDALDIEINFSVATSVQET